MNFKLNPNPFSQSKVKPSRLSSLLLPPTPIITHHILTAKYLLSASHRANSGAGQIHPGFPALGFLYVLSPSLGIFFSLLILCVPFHLLDSASMTLSQSVLPEALHWRRNITSSHPYSPPSSLVFAFFIALVATGN